VKDHDEGSPRAPPPRVARVRGGSTERTRRAPRVHAEAPAIATRPLRRQHGRVGLEGLAEHDHRPHWMVRVSNRRNGGPNYHLWSDTAPLRRSTSTRTTTASRDVTLPVPVQEHLQRSPRPATAFLRVSSGATGYAAVKAADDPGQNLRQTYTVTKVVGRRRTGASSVVGSDFPVAPPNTGPKFTPNYENIAAKQHVDDGRDPFDDGRLQGVRRAQAGRVSSSTSGPSSTRFTIRDFDTRGNVGNMGGGVNSISGFNVAVIAIQIPIPNLGTLKNSTVGRVVLGEPPGRHGAQAGRQGRGRLRSLGPGVAARQPAHERAVHPDRAQGPVERERADGRHRSEGPVPPVFPRPRAAKLLKALYNINVPPTPRNDLAVLLPDTLKVRTDIKPPHGDGRRLLREPGRRPPRPDARRRRGRHLPPGRGRYLRPEGPAAR